MNIVWSPSEYAAASVIAEEAGQELVARLEWMSIAPRRVLNVGAGLGRLSDALQARFAQADIIHLEFNEAMLEAGCRAKPGLWLQADARQLPLANQSVDLVIANLLLPWIEDAPAVLAEWRRVLTPNGLLMLSTLGPDTLKEWRAQINPDVLTQCVDMHNVGDALVTAGFIDPVIDVSQVVLSYARLEDLAAECRASGMGWQAAPVAETTLEATYEIIQAHAFTKLAGNEFDSNEWGETKIPLAHLRQRLRG